MTIHTRIPVIVFGAKGRMGSRIIALARESSDFEVIAGVDRDADERAHDDPIDGSSPLIAPSQTPRFGGKCRVVIDFSSPDGSRDALKSALELRAPLLVGTTGHSEGFREALRNASRDIAVLVAPNTSIGVALVAAATRNLSAALPGAGISIVEAHHDRKKDAPSGTALRLASAIRDGGGVIRDDQVLAIRGGDVVGEHTVRFACEGEYIEITHRATSRDLFARGALRAAKWLDGRPPGFYSMEDVLGIGA